MLIGHSLAYEYADGHIQFASLNFTIPSGRNALVGANGIGKSLLAKILAGDLEPTYGSIRRPSRVLYLPQIVLAPEHLTVGEYLITLWESDRASLITQLLGDLPMDRPLTYLSGGEWMRVRIAHALLQSWDFLILDEPTNNLDSNAREMIIETLATADFSFLVISHDRKLLRQVDRIFELSSKGLQLYGGEFDFYLEQKLAERARSLEQIETAKFNNKKRERERVEKIEAQEKRTRAAAKKSADMGLPKILIGARKRRAQKTASKIKVREDKLVGASAEDLSEAIEAQKKERLLYFELPETEFPSGKNLLQLQDFNFRYHGSGPSWLWNRNLNLSFNGPVRLAIQGANGRGKSTLLKILLGINTGEGESQGRLAFAKSPTVYLDQNYGILDPRKSVLENVHESSKYDEIEIRNLLARFLFQKEQVYQEAETLSGGERMRASLAKALLSKNTPQILILDEPTNNLDLESIEFLEKILRKFQGALIVICHDEDFLKNIGCNQTLNLDSQ